MRKIKKRVIALLLVVVLASFQLITSLASDSLTGSGWWTDCQTSTAQTLSDDSSVTFCVDITSNSLSDGEYAAFCVEATDGESYFTGTSDGDCWGAGTDTDGTSSGVVVGGRYLVTISRNGNNFTADIVDFSTGSSILGNSMYLEGTSEFGDTTCYIMTQVGDLTVSIPNTGTLTGSGWWTSCETSTGINIEDGYTVTFKVEVTSDSLSDGDYAAFCVEATDGTSYFTATSDGDCWGAGADTDGTSTGVVVGGSYTVTISRSGNNFTADIVDDATGSSILANQMYLTGTADFGATTCYIMTQVGNLTVTSYEEMKTTAASYDTDSVSGSTSTTVSVHDPSIVKGYVEDSVTGLSADTEIVGEKDATHTKGIYFIFGSHLAWAYSWDLVNWTTFTNNLNTYYETIFAKEAAWAATGDSDYTVDGNMWAPDVIWVSGYDNGDGTEGAWCMYMSINGNSWNSAICLLVSDSLYGSWTYVGSVIYSGFDNSTYTGSGTEDYFAVTGDATVDERYLRSSATSYAGNSSTWWNISYGAHAIDPCVTYDKDGNLWMSYGSWSGGIYMIRLDTTTGLRDTTVTYEYEADTSDPYMGYKIAGGYASSGEGSYIEYYGGYYYLVVSYGGYAQDGGYNMRVYRSTSITGPYVDESGDTASYTSYKNNYATGSGLISTLGMRWMSNYKWSYQTYAQVAQGHNSVYYDEDTDQIYLVYHTKTNDGTAGHYVNVHQLIQNEDGWLLAAPFTYADETTTNEDITSSTYDASKIAGNYEVIVHALAVDYANLEYVDPVYIVLSEDGTISGDLSGTWTETDNTCYLTLVIDGETYHGVLLTETVEGTTKETITFTAVGTSSEVAIWGYQYDVVETETEYLTLPAQTVNGTLLDLVTTGTYGASISWASSSADVIATDGTVTVPGDNTDVTLTATISYDGEETATKEFTVTVIGSNSVDEDGNVVVWSSSGTYDLTNATQGTYAFTNYFNSTIGTTGLTLYSGVSIKFAVELTGDYNLFSNILGFTVDGDTSGNILYFTGGSYLGYNGTGGYFDANCDTSTWTPGTDYIGSGQEVEFEIVILPNSYEVYVGGEIAYSMDTVDSGETSGSYAMDSMYSVLTYLSETATEFDLGWGSWWTGGFAGTISNISLTAYASTEDESGLTGYLYKETYNSLAGATGSDTGWYSKFAQSALSVVRESSSSTDWYLEFAYDSTASGSRGAYLALNGGSSLTADGDTYTVKADVEFTNNSLYLTNQFAIMGETPSSSVYNSTISSGYIVLLSQTAANTYAVNGSNDTITISSGTWVTVSAYVNKNTKTAYVTIANRDTGDVLFADEVSFDVDGELYGLYLTKTRGGAACLDNIGVSYSVGTVNGDGSIPSSSSESNYLVWYTYSNFFRVDVTEDFSVNWKFYNYSDIGANYTNYAIAVTTDLTRTYELGEGEDWYLRNDAYSNATFKNSTVTYELSSNWDWDTYATMMNGAYVDATLTRDGDTMTFYATILGSDGETYTYQAVAANASTEEALAVYLGGEGCYLEIVEFSLTDDICHYDNGVVTDPTCTADGYTTYTCSYCGEAYVSDITEATGHTYETYEDTDNNYTTHTCSVCGNTYNTITVVVSSLSTTGTSVSATLTGGGSDYVVGDDVTVGAPSVTNYSFIGWYNADGTDEEGYATGYDDSNEISAEPEYTFAASTNVSLVAVYRADSAMSLTVKSDNLNGAAYSLTVNGEAVTTGTEDDFMADYEAGASVTLTAAKDVEGVTFAYWMNGSSKIVGTEETYTFTIVADTVIYPVYNVSGSSNNTAIVDYVTYYGQVLVRYTYTSDSTTVTAPSTLPTRTGYTFSGWSMSETEIVEEIKVGTTSIEVTPKYTKDSKKYTVNVYTYADSAENLSETYSDQEAGGTLTVKAPEVSGKTFQYWTDGTDGTILSYKESYMVYLSQNIDLYAVYGDNSVTDAASTIVMTNVYTVTELTSDSDMTCKIAFEATRSVLEGYTVLETGFLLSTSSVYASSETLVIGADSNDAVTRYISSSTERDGVFTLYVDMTEKTDTTVYAVGYMVISDDDGNLSYCYTDVSETTYNNLNSESTE